MTANGPSSFDRAWPLIEAACAGTISDRQLQDLQELLRGDAALQRAYLQYCRLHAELRCLCRAGAANHAALAKVAQAETADAREPADACDAARWPVIDCGPLGQAGPLPSSGFAGVWHGAAAYLLGHPWALSYLTATVFFAVMFAAGSFVSISLGPEQTSWMVSGKEPSRPPEALEYVGRITGTLDCRWAGSQHAPSAAVALGRKYELASGLVEIAYKTGANVILQGPCIYEVDSPAGGFLSLGKLTARVEKSKIRNPKSQVSNSQSLIPDPLFSVRTHTAIVTDLGTEFGVEVDGRGETRSHVFVGEVRVSSVGAPRRAGATATLHAGQTAHCNRREGIVVSAAPAGGDRFVRSLRPETLRIVEKFDGPKLCAALEQAPPGHYAVGRGAAVYRQPAGGRQSRGYIRTVATDFCNCDFVCEVTIDVRLDAADFAHVSHQVFFGIGSGEPNPNFYDDMTCGLAMGFIVDSGVIHVQAKRPEWTAARVVDEPAVAEFMPSSGPLLPGRHRLRMVKRGKWLQFLVDAEFNGQFKTDYQTRWIDLAADMPLLKPTNSRLVVGTGNCDTMSVRFEDLSIVYTNTPVSKGKPAMHDP